MAEAAAEELGASIEVIDLRSLVPLDAEAIEATARKTGKVLVAHEATRSAGVGAEVAAIVSDRCFEHLDAPVRRLTAPDVPIPFSPPLEQAVLPQPDDMKEACRELLSLLTPASGRSTIVMPRMGVSVAEGTIVEWRKAPGDEVAADETICEATTDKIDVEIPAPAAGVLGRVLVEVGRDGGRGHRARRAGGRGRAARASSECRRARRRARPRRRGARDGEIDRSTFYSPVVRRIAGEHGIDLATVEGGGVGGRVRKADLVALIERGLRQRSRAAAAQRVALPARTRAASPGANVPHPAEPEPRRSARAAPRT